MGQAELQRALSVAMTRAGLDKLCFGCGGLTPITSCLLVVRGDADPPTCRECGLFVDERGNAAGHLGSDGRVYCRVIRLPA